VRIKLDENVPSRAIEVFAHHGHDVDTVREEGLAGCSDGEIWEAAKADGRLLVTQDLDFSDIRRYRPGTHPGLLLVRLREPGATELVRKLGAVAGDLSTWAGCFVVLTDHKIRVKRP
jgi:predicted nuclease of predicted toxin-antitoxin system